MNNLCNYPELEASLNIQMNLVIIDRKTFDLIFKHWEEIKKIIDQEKKGNKTNG